MAVDLYSNTSLWKVGGIHCCLSLSSPTRESLERLGDRDHTAKDGQASAVSDLALVRIKSHYNKYIGGS